VTHPAGHGERGASEDAAGAAEAGGGAHPHRQGSVRGPPLAPRRRAPGAVIYICISTIMMPQDYIPISRRWLRAVVPEVPVRVCVYVCVCVCV
jgi:hypothetical protein